MNHQNKPEGAACVICDGPFSNQDNHGDEYPTWFVGFGDDHGIEFDGGSHFRSLGAAQQAARELARKFKLELVDESSDA